MKIIKIPIPKELALDCDGCRELPARVRLIVNGNASERLCALCLGVMMMEIESLLRIVLEELDEAEN